MTMTPGSKWLVPSWLVVQGILILSLLLLGVFGVFLYEAANGRSGAVFGVLLAAATVTYLVSLALLNRRT